MKYYPKTDCKFYIEKQEYATEPDIVENPKPLKPILYLKTNGVSHIPYWRDYNPPKEFITDRELCFDTYRLHRRRDCARLPIPLPTYMKVLKLFPAEFGRPPRVMNLCEVREKKRLEEEKIKAEEEKVKEAERLKKEMEEAEKKVLEEEARLAEEMNKGKGKGGAKPQAKAAAPAKSADGKAAEAKPTDGKPEEKSEAKAGAKPEAKPADAKAGAKPEEKPADAKVKPADSKPTAATLKAF